MEANPFHRMIDEEKARLEQSTGPIPVDESDSSWSDYRGSFPKGTSNKARKKAAIRKRFNKARGAATRNA